MKSFSFQKILNIKSNGNNTELKIYPFYIQATFILLGLILLFYILSVLGDILIPLCFSLLLAILLNPLVNWLVSKKINNVIAIILALLLAFMVIVGVTFFVSLQIAKFTEMLPELKDKFNLLIDDVQQWILYHIGYPITKQNELIQKIMNNSEGMIGSTLLNVINIGSAVLLIPIYVFLILYYKKLLLNFIYESFDDENSETVEIVLAKTKGAVQSYVSGLLWETFIVAILNSIALYILGVPYAIMLGSIGALLNLVPYIGGVIAIALPILMSIVTQEGYTTPLLIIIAYSIIQLIDNNILVPRIVASKVSVNALVSIVIVLLGNALWGVSGMFLSIPFIGILKIIFDNIDRLNPWGKLLGTKMPTKNDPISIKTHVIVEEKEITIEDKEE
ncbi:conserved membrane hypothetical protein [uncultured Paludibacter sp.]|uniref:Permease n=1 Tax=uncultured Paludibacter sp. TaxID=497635 RepID=A0A653AJA3_9BACT|nr:conserved membrane hypothetical protein [uncultured Paludibacter sp.]